MEKLASLNNQVYLYIGSADIIKKLAITFAQNLFCSNYSSKACLKCNECLLTMKKQHWNLKFITPKSINYNLSDLEEIFNILRFKLIEPEKVCIILENADLLTPSCANSLLKLLEEPSPGYFIILLAQNKNSMLPTVSSRCITQYFTREQEVMENLLESFFQLDAKFSPVEFNRVLDKIELAETVIINLLDKLNADLLNNVETNDQSTKAQQALEILAKVRNNLPLPGSYKFFLKNIYLKLSQL